MGRDPPPSPRSLRPLPLPLPPRLPLPLPPLRPSLRLPPTLPPDPCHVLARQDTPRRVPLLRDLLRTKAKGSALERVKSTDIPAGSPAAVEDYCAVMELAPEEEWKVEELGRAGVEVVLGRRRW